MIGIEKPKIETEVNTLPLVRFFSIGFSLFLLSPFYYKLYNRYNVNYFLPLIPICKIKTVLWVIIKKKEGRKAYVHGGNL